MSEFKFACPVCGQHITADSGASGTQLECPTCFQKIIVPQAGTGDSKLIVSASQVAKPRETANGLGPELMTPVPARKSLPFVVFLLVVVAIGAAAFAFRDKIFPKKNQTVAKGNSTSGSSSSHSAPKVVRPVPTNIIWTLDLTNATIPKEIASGAVNGEGFLCERTTLQGGNLTLRQGKDWPPDLGASVVLFARAGEELAGKTVEVSPDRSPPVPRVVVRWKDAEGKAVTRTFHEGYALKLEFGDAVANRMQGSIYLCVPDDSKSVIAGTFEAEIRKPSVPKPQKPKTPKPPKPAA